jgi:hypothetical protein
MRSSLRSTPKPGALRHLAPRVTLFLLVAGLSGAGQIVGCDTGKGSCLDLGVTCGGLCWLIGDAAKDVALEERRQSKLDEACGACPEGQGCNLLADPPVCQKREKSSNGSFTRTYIGEKGAPCGEHEASGRTYVCSDDTFCGGSTEPKRCVEKLPLGAACSAPNQCARDLYCDKQTSVCTAWRQKGEACERIDNFDPCAGLYLCGRASKRCLSRRKEGEACGEADPEGLPCGGRDLVCGSTLKKCVRFRERGAPCDDDSSVCAPGYICGGPDKAKRCI